jgi:flagellar assembly protein FliH
LFNLPKEQQTAYQRWEMTCFGDERPSAVAARERAASAEPELEHQHEAAQQPRYPTVEELAQIQTQAHAEGRAEGHAEGLEEGHAEGLGEGRAQGLEEGRAEGRAAGHAEALEEGRAANAIELEHVRALAKDFSGALAAADQLIATDVLDLALHLARGMLGEALRARPELILPIVNQALAALPALQLPARLALNPADADAVRDSIGYDLTDAGWTIVEDTHVGRGGCRIDTTHNQIDAQAATRWQRLTHGLGKDLDWLEP